MKLAGLLGWSSEKKDRQAQKKQKSISITDAKELLEMAATRLSQLIARILTLHGSMPLDIKAGSMSGTTAADVHDTYSVV